MKKNILVFTILLMTVSSVASSQFFREERVYVGPTIGYGLGFGFGASGEYGLTENIGLGIDLGYSSFTQDFGSLLPGSGLPKWKYTLLAGLVTGAYHFTPHKSFDPFIKLGIGYFNYDVKYVVDDKDTTAPFGSVAGYASGVGISGQIGARFHLSDNVSLRTALGYPYFISAGVDFAFGGVPSKARKSRPDSSSTDAQSDGSAPTEKEKPKESDWAIHVGPYVTLKGGINTAVAPSRRTGPSFNGTPDLGITAFLPFNKSGNLGFGLDIGYSTLSYIDKPGSDSTTNDHTTIKEKYSFINVGPFFDLGNFVLGINFGFPSSGESKTLRDSSVSQVVEFQESPDGKVILGSRAEVPTSILDYSKYLNTTIEVRAGVMVPILNEGSHRLNLIIQGSYLLNSLYTDYRNYKNVYYDLDNNNNIQITQPIQSNSPSPVTASIGINYFFRIGL